MTRAPLALVLFDLDGTLVDTAADLGAAANRLRGERALDPLPISALRPFTSQGARGLIGRALGVTPQDAEFAVLRDRFLALYEQALCVHSCLFDGMADLLAALEDRGLRWGIVTNKMARYTDPLVRALGLDTRAACVVSGDTTPHAKPHPQPLHHALAAAGVAAECAVYVGDDERDIVAGRAAGLATVAAAYGYLGPQGRPAEWGADALADDVAQLHDLLLAAARAPAASARPVPMRP